MSIRHVCDVQGCTRERKRWQRICEVCFAALSGNKAIRHGILEAHRTRNFAERRRLSRRAGAELGYTAPRPAQPATLAKHWWQRD